MFGSFRCARILRWAGINLLALAALGVAAADPYGLSQAFAALTSGSRCSIPVPEPSTLALLVTALAGLGFVVARRRDRGTKGENRNQREGSPSRGDGQM